MAVSLTFHRRELAAGIDGIGLTGDRADQRRCEKTVCESRPCESVSHSAVFLSLFPLKLNTRQMVNPPRISRDRRKRCRLTSKRVESSVEAAESAEANKPRKRTTWGAEISTVGPVSESLFESSIYMCGHKMRFPRILIYPDGMNLPRRRAEA